MAFSHRKMLEPFQERKDFTFSFFIPCIQTYPPSSPPPPPPLVNSGNFASGSKQQRDFSILVSTLIAVIGSTLLFLSIIVFLFLYFKKSRRNSTAVAPLNINRRQNGDEAQETNITETEIDHHVWRITTVGLQRSAIDSITVIEFKKGEAIIDSTQCSVCLNEFQEDDSLRILPKCSHAFHVNCIDTWLLSHKNCPLCRAPVLLKEKTITKSTHHQTTTMIDSVSSNELSREEENSRIRNIDSLPREQQSDSASNCGTKTVKRSVSSIVGSSSQSNTKITKKPLFSSFSAKFSSSLRRSINQDQVFTNRSLEDSD